MIELVWNPTDERCLVRMPGPHALANRRMVLISRSFTHTVAVPRSAWSAGVSVAFYIRALIRVVYYMAKLENAAWL